MALYRAVLPLTGFSGGPGTNTWHFITVSVGPSGIADAILNTLATAYNAGSDILQSDVTVNFPLEVTELDEGSGQAVGVESLSVEIPPVDGTSSQGNAHFMSAKVQMKTGQWVNGREVRGGVFLGPCGGGTQTDGTWSSTSYGHLTDFVNALQTEATNAGVAPVVYKRPSSPGAGDGQAVLASSVTVWRTPAVMRSRRD